MLAATLTIQVFIENHPNDLNTVQTRTSTHIHTEDGAEPIVVWDAILTAIAEENAGFNLYH